MTINIAQSRFKTPDDVNAKWIVFDKVGLTYRSAGSEAIHALDDVSFDVRQGEVFGIIGRSGAGKSSLIRLVNGLERPSSGRIIAGGTDVAALSGRELTAFRRQTGMIFQGFNLLSSKTVLENVALSPRLAGQRGPQARKLALEALDLVGLATKAKAYPSQLSGGQKQRAGIARAIVQKPKLLLSDEATSALDPETTSSILSLLSEINRQLGLTLVLITHEMEVIRQIADRVGVLDHGRLVETGPVWKVFGAPKHPVTQALLGRGGDQPHDARQRQPGEIVYRINLSGPDFGDPDLFAIVTAIGPGARLVRGGLERIGGRPSGRLSIAAPKGLPGQAEAVLARLREIIPSSEIESHAS